MFTYDIEWCVNDDGAQNHRLILHLPSSVKMADVVGNKFSVYVERKNKNGELLFVKPRWDAPEPILSKGYRRVVAAYPSDSKGNPLLTGSCITLEMDLEDDQSRALVGELSGSVILDSFYRITQISPIGDLTGMVFDELGKIYCPETERYTSDISSFSNMPLKYSFFTPLNSSEGDLPLIIWLHGAGEGGDDPRVTYLGNRVPALSSDPIQSFMGGAWVLTPTSPTMWMDRGTGSFEDNDGTSIYSEALFALIEEFVDAHPVDRTRIYVGGCSNGGFMTMRLLIDHPGYFAAAFPMCEALFDKFVSDEDIEKIKDTPIWFLHAMTDEVVDPKQTSVPAYHRLMKAGAKNVHFTYIDDRPPMNKMINHGCWSIGLNNGHNYDFDGKPVMLDNKEVTRFEWLAGMRLQ